MKKKPVALQTFTVRDELAKDFRGTMEKLAGIGYKAIEVGGDTGGMTPSEFRKFLDRLGMKAISLHTPYDQLTADLGPAIKFAKDLGLKFMVCPVAGADSEAGWRAIGEALDKAGAKLRKEGIRLCYHNHSHEMASVGDKKAIDIVLGSASSENLSWQLDTYWVKAGGSVPQDMIRKYAGRVPLLHVKDMTAGEQPTFAEVGEGILDWKQIFAAADEARVEWYIVEQDTCQKPPLESARISLQNLKKMGAA